MDEKECFIRLESDYKVFITGEKSLIRGTQKNKKIKYIYTYKTIIFLNKI